MRVFLENEGDLELGLNYMEVAEKVCEAVLDMEKCPYESQVELLLTMNDVIHEINLDTREIDRPTDVLSFPMIMFDEPSEYDFLEEADAYFDLDTGELMLGNIVISKEKVVEQATEFGHSILREYAFLIAHSMLHLLGYDHMNDEEREIMESKQREVMEIVGISR